MASKAQKNRGAKLPDEIDGHDLICVTLRVPDAPEYRAAFLGQVKSLAKAYFWEMSYEGGDNRASRAGLYWRDIYDQHPVVFGDCGRSETCVEIPLYDPRIEWEPNDPYTSPGLVPDGYLFPPWYIQKDFPPSIVGAKAGDIVTDLARITAIAGWQTQYPIPRFRINLSGAGVLQVYLRRIEQGGFAQVQVNGDLLSLRYANTNLTQTPPPETMVIIEREFSGGENFVDISAFPNVFEGLIPVGFGFAVEKILLCGFGITPDCPNCPEDNCGCDECEEPCGDCLDCS